MFEIVRELNDYGANNGGSACLVHVNGEYFIVSSIPHGPETGEPETLAFAADVDGEITNWGDVAGGRHKSREETIAELDSIGPDSESQGRGLFGDTKLTKDRTLTEVLEGTLSSLQTLIRSMDGKWASEDEICAQREKESS